MHISGRLLCCTSKGRYAADYQMPCRGVLPCNSGQPTACPIWGRLHALQRVACALHSRSSSPLHPLQRPPRRLHPCSGLYPLQHCTPTHGPHALQQGSSSLAVRFDRRCRSAQPCLLAASSPWKQCKSMPSDIYAPGAASRPLAHPAPQHSSNGPTCGNSPGSSICSAACPPPRTSPRWPPPGTPSALRTSCLWGLGLHTWGGCLVQPDHRLMLEVVLCLITVLEVHCVVPGGCVEGHYGSQVPFLHAGPQHAYAHVHNLQHRQVWDHPPFMRDAGHVLPVSACQAAADSPAGLGRGVLPHVSSLGAASLLETCVSGAQPMSLSPY